MAMPRPSRPSAARSIAKPPQLPVAASWMVEATSLNSPAPSVTLVRPPCSRSVGAMVKLDSGWVIGLGFACPSDSASSGFPSGIGSVPLGDVVEGLGVRPVGLDVGLPHRLELVGDVVAGGDRRADRLLGPVGPVVQRPRPGRADQPERVGVDRLGRRTGPAGPLGTGVTGP